MPDNKINFAYTLERKLKIARAVAVVLTWQDFKLEILFVRIQKAQLLGVMQKNIDVMAFAVCCATSERPIFNDRLFRVHLVNERAGYSE